jgi:hypothetical protein
MSFYLGDICNSSEFKDMYLSNWDKYIESNKNVIDSYCISSSSEYFAEIFSEYICAGEYLKENFYEGYQHFNHLANEPWRYSKIIGKYYGIVTRMGRVVKEKAEVLYNKPAFFIKKTINNHSVSDNPYINIDDYDYLSHHKFQHEESEEIYIHVMDILTNPNQYEDQISYEFDYEVDFSVYQEINGFFKIYFMDDRNDIVNFSVNLINEEQGFTTTIYIDKQHLLQLEETRFKYLMQVEQVLSSKIREGSDREKLIQISTYMIEKCQYGLILSDACAERFWNAGCGNDIVFAMVFKQFANRLGMQCDIILSPMDNGLNHVFNKVTLSDGSVYYYDLVRHDENKIDVQTYDLILFTENQFLD